MNAVSFSHTSTTKVFSGILTTMRMRNLTLPTDTRHLNVLPQEESSTVIKEPIGIVYTDHINSSSNTILTEKDLQLPDAREHKYARVLSATDDEGHSQTDNIIKQIIQTTNQEEEESQSDNGSDQESQQKTQVQLEQQSAVNSGDDDEKDALLTETNKQADQTAMPDARVRQLRDQLIKARVYLSLPAIKNNPHFTRELRMRVKEVQRVLVDATKDSDLPKNAYAKLNAMDQLLEKGKQMQDDCATMVKKLRAMLHSTEEQLRVHKKQTMFLTQLTAKTLPKGLHCLPLRLTTEYYNLNSTEQQFPNQEKLDDPSLHHIALFSDNVLAAAVVVNSTITNSKIEATMHVDLQGILSISPLPLSQGVLLALLQQLACDFSNETSRKLAWMTDVAAAINPTDPMIAMHRVHEKEKPEPERLNMEKNRRTALLPLMKKYNVERQVSHYVTMVDLLGRA
ncbi:hypothetical protein NC651_034598 [Populus alba x Populus x berolinensis]|nr:hypothetical protein NC651_034598 [Populus alba x Populus x berolinensis]